MALDSSAEEVEDVCAIVLALSKAVDAEEACDTYSVLEAHGECALLPVFGDGRLVAADLHAHTDKEPADGL